MSEYMFCEKDNCNGKLALATETIWSVDPDQEPFKEGELKDISPISTVIDVGCHICVECHEIHDIFINEPEDKIQNYLGKQDLSEALITAYKSMEKLEKQQNLFIPAKSIVANALQKAGIQVNEKAEQQ